MVRQTRADSSDGSSDETGNSSDTERYYPKPFGDQPTNWSGRPAVWDSKTGKWLDVRPTESEALAASRVAAASGSDVISVSQAGVRVATVVLGKPGTSYGESEGWIRVCFYHEARSTRDCRERSLCILDSDGRPTPHFRMERDTYEALCQANRARNRRRLALDVFNVVGLLGVLLFSHGPTPRSSRHAE